MAIRPKTYSDIVFSQFKGFANKFNQVNPKLLYFILNMDFEADGSLRPRGRLKKLVDLPGAHSPFKLNNGLFVVASYSESGITSLYNFDIQTKKLSFIADLGEFYSPLFYVQVDNLVFISCLYWNGILNCSSWALSPWIDITFSSTYDTLEASQYVLADAIPMPKVKYLTLFKGTIYGAKDNRVYYAEPLIHKYSKPHYFYEFSDNITSLASTKDFMFIGGEKQSYVAFYDILGESFTLRIEKVEYGCLDNSAVAIEEKVFFLTSSGMGVTDGKLTKIITQDTVEVNNTAPAISGKLSDTGFLSGGEPTSFTDKVICDVVKKAKKDV